MLKLVDKGVIIKEFLPQGEIQQVLVCLHGFAGDSESSVILELANNLNKKNVLVVTFDFPCHGNDDAFRILNLNECFNYLKIVDDYIKNEYKDVDFSYFATSFGAFVLLNFLQHTNYFYNKIILRAPAIFMDRILKDNILPGHNFDLEDLKAHPLNLGLDKQLMVDWKFYQDLINNSLENFRTNKFLYIIQGKKDNVVDFKENEAFFEKCCSPNYKIIYFENADHRFKNEGELEEIVQIVEGLLVNK